MRGGGYITPNPGHHIFAKNFVSQAFPRHSVVYKRLTTRSLARTLARALVEREALDVVDRQTLTRANRESERRADINLIKGLSESRARARKSF